MSTSKLVSADQALPGRATREYRVGDRHAVLGAESAGRPLEGAVPPGHEEVYLAMGCFWGAERHFWRLPGVWVTAVGYQGGHTSHPRYEEVCTGRTGHAETVRVVYDPKVLPTDVLLAEFWTAHDPTARRFMRRVRNSWTPSMLLRGAIRRR
jgi:peptide-methionine (S)-S-oxide reductase